MSTRVVCSGLFLGATLLTLASCTEEVLLPERTETIVGPEGGAAQSADSLVILEFPAGAVSQSVRITIEVDRKSHRPGLVSSLYHLGPDGQTFAAPVTVQLALDTTTATERLRLAQFDANGATALRDSVWLPDQMALRATVSHFSIYGALDFDEETCLADCPIGCPAPEYWMCASDGQRYCNECIIGCHGLTVADGSVCAEWDRQACLNACGVGCPAPEYWICASDGQRYCNQCIIGCEGLTVADDSVCVDWDREVCLDACGDGCPAPEYWVCASDGERYCNACVVGCYGLTVVDDTVCDDVEQCVMSCGFGCPAPEYWICASDGQRYCNACVIDCHGLTVADDSVCDDQQACVESCGFGCPAPEYWICASDGQRYCNECLIDCYGLTVANPDTCS